MQHACKAIAYAIGVHAHKCTCTTNTTIAMQLHVHMHGGMCIVFVLLQRSGVATGWFNKMESNTGIAIILYNAQISFNYS